MKKRILHVNIDNNGGNGAFALVMYLYSNLKSDYIFDFYTMGKFIESKELENIEKLGGKVYSADLRKNKFLGHLKLPFKFKNCIKRNNYDTVHIHSEVAYKVFLYVLGARLAGVKRIIIHAHSSKIDGNYVLIKKIAHNLTKKAICKQGTDFLAISEDAANWLFTKDVINDKQHFNYLTNGISPQNYCFNEETRRRMRQQFNIADDVILIGHVGALKKVKNQPFLIEIMYNLKNSDVNTKLMLVGEGEDRKKLEQKIEQLGLLNDVLLLGTRSDVSDLMQAFDILVFPSFFEGVPMTLIEAQCIGMPIIASDTIQNTIKVNNNVKFESLNKGIEYWCQIIKDNIDSHIYTKGFENVYDSKYNIKSSAKKLASIYSGKK